jgi:hypothetical protein
MEDDNFPAGSGKCGWEAGSTAAKYEGSWTGEFVLMDVEWKRKVGWVRKEEKLRAAFDVSGCGGGEEAVIRRLKGELPAPPAEPNLSRDCIMPF